MPYPPEHREKTRRRIVAAARREMNRSGFAEASIDSIMSEAGLTRGGFYAHFASKEDLLLHVLRDMIERPLPFAEERFEPENDDRDALDPLVAFVSLYLSAEHRDRVQAGCSVAPLSPEIGRAGQAVRAVFQEFALRTRDRVALSVGGGREGASDVATGVLATCVGGLLLSRAVADPAVSDKILDACRRAALVQAGRGDG